MAAQRTSIITTQRLRNLRTHTLPILRDCTASEREQKEFFAPTIRSSRGGPAESDFCRLLPPPVRFLIRILPFSSNERANERKNSVHSLTRLRTNERTQTQDNERTTDGPTRQRDCRPRVLRVLRSFRANFAAVGVTEQNGRDHYEFQCFHQLTCLPPSPSPLPSVSTQILFLFSRPDLLNPHIDVQPD